MNKVINVTLDSASIDAAVKEIREYAERVRRKTDELRERIAEMISNQAQAGFNTSIADSGFMVINGNAVDDTRFGGVTVSHSQQGENTTVIITDGKDAAFIEFGAGVYFNGAVGSSPNPWGIELGYTIGSFGLGNGSKNVWGYRGDDGEIHLTHGAPASMPLYRAVQSVTRDIEKIAREVFSP